MLLDAPLGGDVTLHDLLAGGLPAPDETCGFIPTDARLAALLRSLRPTEPAVVFAWTDPGGSTRADAALRASTADPAAVGERVRRRVRRQQAEQDRRRRAQQTGQAAIEGSRW
ncbi:hypothetical protein ACFWIO_17345 [Streptomyces diastatochromogenes]|uniref:hypothetical protein n=1 Tax=Streptomyces diastatochromogenes TaxID=42236 RepID=UPI00364CFCC4